MRVRGGALAGLFVLSAAVGGCSESSGSTAAPPVTTIAIATEVPAASTAPAAPPTAVSTTVVASTTTLVPPVPVLVRVTPKNDAERELLDAMKELLEIEHEWANDPRISVDRLRKLLPSGEVEAAIAENRDRDATGRFSIPGELDRYVVEEAMLHGPTEGDVVVCYANQAVAYRGRGVSQTTVVVDDSLVSRRIRYRITKTGDGWRLANALLLSKVVGKDTCGS